MTTPSKVYLDTSILYGWFEYKLKNKKIESGIIEFLTERCKNIEKFISAYSYAELLVKLKKEFQGRKLTADNIKYLFEILKDTIGLKIIMETKLTGTIIDFADLCNDYSDAIHIEIAKNENLTLITRDEGMGKSKEAYSNVMSIGKLMKQFN